MLFELDLDGYEGSLGAEALNVRGRGTQKASPLKRRATEEVQKRNTDDECGFPQFITVNLQNRS
jgi:hypothetical protein